MPLCPSIFGDHSINLAYGKLLAASEGGTGQTLLEEVDVRELVRRWGLLNAVRCCMPVLGATVVGSALK